MPNRRALTPRREKFAQIYVETGNASEAYRAAFKTDAMQPNTVWRRAAELLQNGVVAARISDLQAELVKRHAVTVDDLVLKLQTAMTIAEEDRDSKALTAAALGLAKMLGLGTFSKADAPDDTKRKAVVLLPARTDAKTFQEMADEWLAESDERQREMMEYVQRHTGAES